MAFKPNSAKPYSHFLFIIFLFFGVLGSINSKAMTTDSLSLIDNESGEALGKLNEDGEFQLDAKIFESLVSNTIFT